MKDLPDDDIRVQDRRRFSADGEPRAEADNAAPPDGGEAAPAPDMVPAEELETWRQRARAAEARLAELADGYRRAREELDAVRGRLARDHDARVHTALGRTFEKILAIVDNLDRALEHADAGPLTDGIALVRRQLLDALAAEGVERIDVVGKPFDPGIAEAVSTCPVEDPEQAQMVAAEMRAGYRFGDKALRPAQVRVTVLSGAPGRTPDQA